VLARGRDSAVLRISTTQMAALEAYYTEEFARQMTATLLRAFPTECKAKGSAAVLAFVRESVARARALGTTLESDFRRHVTTEFVVGVAVMEEMLSEQRERLLSREGIVDPTVLIFLTYQAMFARL